MDEEVKVIGLIDQLSDKRRDACSIIDRMDRPEEAAVLFYRYIKNMTWEQVAIESHVSERNVHYIHGRALQTFEHLMK